MYHTKAQAVMDYHLRLSKILQIEELAEQMHKLADSYLKEEKNSIRVVREGNTGAVYAVHQDSPGEVLMEQAQELRAVAADWYKQAKQEYQENLQEVDRAENGERMSG